MGNERPLIYGGQHPERGRLYAACNPVAKNCGAPEVAGTRLGAWLRPYPTAASAALALRNAGVVEAREVQ